MRQTRGLTGKSFDGTNYLPDGTVVELNGRFTSATTAEGTWRVTVPGPDGATMCGTGQVPFKVSSSILMDGESFSNSMGERYNGDGFPIKISGNVVNRNRLDGILVDSTTTSVIGNRVWMNGGLGIEAPDVTAGRNNAASRNGNPAQCVPTSLCSVSTTP